jgi:DNA-binding CsgD family transcriptional regulator
MTAVFVYLVACYSIGAIGLAAAIVSALLRGEAIQRAYALFMAAFTFEVVSLTVFSYLLVEGQEADTVVSLITLALYCGIALITVSLPRFVALLSGIRWAGVAGRVFVVLGAIAWAVAVISLRGPWSRLSVTILLLLLVAAITFSATMGAVSALAARKRRSLSQGGAEDRTEGEQGEAEAERQRWSKLMDRIEVLTLAFLPFFVIIDFFPELLPGLTGWLSPAFKTAPLFYAIWNLLYLREEIAFLARARNPHKRMGEAALGLEDFAAFDLSPRECEVACLLVGGASYKEIAESLAISLATVKTHITRIYQKSGTGTKIDLLIKLRARKSLDQPFG